MSATKNINAEKIQGNLSITSVSATTYYNLPSSGGSFTGGTVSGDTIFIGGLTANTFSATTYQNLPNTTLQQAYTASTSPEFTINSTQLGVQFRNDTGDDNTPMVLVQNNAGTTKGEWRADGTIYNSGLYSDVVSATTYYNLPTDIRVTGGTYSAGTATFTNNTGGTFSVTGFTTGITTSNYVAQGRLNADQSITPNGDVIIQFIDDFDPQNWWDASTYRLTPTIAGYYIIDFGVWWPTFGTTTGQCNIQARKNGNTFMLLQTPLHTTEGNSVTGTKVVYMNGSTDYIDFTAYHNNGVSVNIQYGSVNGQGTWFSAALISSNPNSGSGGGSSTFTGGTVNGATNFTAGLTANTISATTYYNLPTDIRVTGGTYSSGTAVFTNNTGGTFSVTGFSTGDTSNTSFTGGTVSGATNFIGGLSANTFYTDYIDLNTTYTGLTTQGRLSWDSGTGTLNIGVGDVGGTLIDLQVGQEQLVRVYNSEATTLQKGEIVYVFGSQGNRPSVKRAIATSDGYSVTTLGVITSDIASGDEGYTTTFGIISNLNTVGLTGGTALWLSPTVSGGYTETKPQAPYHTVLIGYVVRVSATVGSIFVNISNGWEIDELHDVRINDKTFGDLLTLSGYNGSDVWVNTKTLNGSYTITGNTTIGGNLTVTGETQSIFSGNTSSDLVRITQTGSGNALVVEDGNNPDTSPFVVNSSGFVGIGVTSPTNLLHISGSTDQIKLYNGSSIWTVSSKSNGDFVAVAAGTRASIYFGSYGVTNSVRISPSSAIIVNSSSDSQFTGAGGVIVNNGLSATTISATTYYNLPTDVYVTGGTYTTGTAVFTNSTGGTFSVSGFSDSTSSVFTGGTVSGATSFIDGLSANTFVITNTPVNNNSNTQVLTRNSSTGNIEYTDSSALSSGGFNYGLSIAISTGNYLI